jgi:uncharacterized Zn finger protein
MADDGHLMHRDQRMLRGALTVTNHYTFEQLDTRTVQVLGGSTPYHVIVHPEWVESPSCSCPDFAKRGGRLYCKHIVAVLMRDNQLRCQLLEMFL